MVARRFVPGARIRVNDSMQDGYVYTLTVPLGAAMVPGFAPAFSPQQMLELGVFEGKYLNDCRNEFPKAWFARAKLSARADPSLNYFGVKSRQPLQVWREKGWILEPDPRGWFQWYCRYYLGRRLPEVDAVQVKRWRAFRRHLAQVQRHCAPMDMACHTRQRQALLQWAYDPFF